MTTTTFLPDFTPYLEVIRRHPTLTVIVNRTLGVLLTLLIARIMAGLLGVVRRRAILRIQRSAPTSKAEINAERALHLETLVNVLYDVLRAVVYGFVVLTALSQFGVSVQPFVAGAGLIGAAVALGSQTVVKDFVSGAFILLENQFAIGDQVSISDKIGGTVERMTLRATVLRDTDGAVHIVPNGSISSVTNRTYHQTGTYVALATPAAAGTQPVREALERAAQAVAARDDQRTILLDSITVNGPTNIKGANLEWSLSARTHLGHGGKAKTLIIEEVVRELAAAQINLV